MNGKRLVRATGSDPTTRYNYTDSTNNIAYENRQDQQSIPPNFAECWDTSDTYVSEAASGDYTALESSDNSRWLTGAVGFGNENWQRFNFTINETVTDITEINLTIEGSCEACDSGEYIYLYFANFSASKWQTLGTEWGTTEVTRKKQITSGFSAIIDTNQLAILAMGEGLGPGEGPETDFVEVLVSYTVPAPPVAVNCSFNTTHNTSWDCSWMCNASGVNTTKVFKIYGGPGELNFTDHNLTYTGIEFNATNCNISLTKQYLWNLTP